MKQSVISPSSSSCGSSFCRVSKLFGGGASKMTTMNAQDWERFESNIEKDKSGCWLWRSAKSGNGYGTFYLRVNGQSVSKRAHRAVWEHKVGIIPEGLWVCHKCDVRNCVNPDHLFLGTPKDNFDDMVSKGRWNLSPLSISKRFTPTLTESQVLQIRELSTGGIGYTNLSKQFGINRSSIRQIIKRQTWKHLPPATPRNNDLIYETDNINHCA